MTPAHRFDRHDVAGRAPEHLFRVFSDRFDAAVDLVDRDDRGLVHDDALAARIHTGVGRPEVDRQVAREERKQ
jgi:hypothetical protein